MYVLIDCTNYQAVATHKDYVALSCLAYIQFANVDSVIFPTDENRPFAQFTGEQLDKIAEGVLNAIDYVSKSETYTGAIDRCRAVINMAKHLVLPFTSEFLAEQASHIKESDERPYIISTDYNRATPMRVNAWAVAPNINRARYAMPTSPQLTRREAAPPAPLTKKELPPPPPTAGASLVPPPPPPIKAPPKPPKAPSAPRAPKASKEPREERNGVRRPAAGSKTVIPWEVADELASRKENKGTDRKTFRAQVIAACVQKGVNTSTASVQFALWAKFTD